METINNRYILHGILGEGGMGVVYRAIDRLTNRQVALKRVYSAAKTLNANAHSDDVHLELAREFQALAALRHPNIISVLDYGFTQDHVPYFTMELLKERRTIMRAGGGLSLEGKVDLLVQVLRALLYIHRHGILHRDLKPSNVLVVRQPQTGADLVKVLDFGLSVEAGEAQGALGTLPYMAPEVLLSSVEHHPPYLTVGVDLHAVGVLGYQLVTGRHPYRIENIETLVHDILYGRPDFSTIDLPPALVKVLERLLMKQPQDRYADAADVIHDLRAALGQPLLTEDSATRDSILQAAKFVGRTQELKQLEDALQQANEGTGSLWLISGESGGGKSRLLDELQTRALVNGITVLRGQGIENGGLPYQLWREPLRQLLLSIPVDDLEAATIKPLVPDIQVLLKRTIPDAPVVSSETAQQRLLTTIVRLFQRHTSTTLLVLEDIHWAIESLEPLKRLLASVHDIPLLVIASYRPEERPTLAQEFPGAPVIALDRLNTEQIALLSASMLGHAGRRPDVLQLLEQETEGNIFFLIEVVRTLAEDAGSLSRVGEATLPTRVFSGGVAMLVRRRLQHAPAWGQALLKRAAVAGRLVDLRVLEALNAERVYLGDHGLSDWLSACADAAVLEHRAGVWRFTHDKLRETLINELGDERPALHREIAQTLEGLHSDPVSRTAYAEILLDHWQRAVEPEKEIHYALIAAAQAVRFTGKYRAAQDWLEHALDLITAGRIVEADRTRMKLLQLLGDALSRQSQYAPAAKQYEASMELAERLSDSPTLIASLTGLAEVSLYQTQLAPALTYAEAGLKISRETADSEGIARSLQLIAQAHLYKGELVEAKQKFTASLSLYRELDLQPEIAGLLNSLGTIASIQGDFSEARSLWEQSYAITQQIGDRYRTGVLLHNLAQIAADQAQFVPALEKVKDAADLFGELGLRQNLGMALNTHGSLLLRHGDIAQGQTLCQESLAIRRAINDRNGVATSTCNVAVSYLLQGEYATAEPLFHESLAFFREAGNRRWIGQTLRDLGVVAYLQGQHELAHEHLSESLTHFEALNDGRGVVFALAVLVGVYVDQLQIPDARANLRRALTLALDLELPMPKIKVLVAATALAAHLEQSETAARWIGLLQQHAATMHEDRLLLDRLRPALLQHSTSACFDQQQASGQTLELDTELTALSQNPLYVDLP